MMLLPLFYSFADIWLVLMADIPQSEFRPLDKWNMRRVLQLGDAFLLMWHNYSITEARINNS